MSGVQEQLEIKFRLHDGSDIGPYKYPAATTVATLKESIVAEWPKGVLRTHIAAINSEHGNSPKTVNDIKLINAGKILENNITLDECKSPICDLTGGVTTMHAIVRPPSEKGIEKNCSTKVDQKCRCVIL